MNITAEINKVLEHLQSMNIPSTYGNIRALNCAMEGLARINDAVARMLEEQSGNNNPDGKGNGESNTGAKEEDA